MAFEPAAYHPKWSLIRRLVLRRAGHRCEWCQAKQRRPHPRTGSRVFLAVAHVDGNRQHNRFHNLACLCQRCHLGLDRAQHLQSRKFGREALAPQYQYCLELEPGPLLLAYRAGLVQLVPSQRQRAQIETANGRLTPRSQLRMTYEPLTLVRVVPLPRSAVTPRKRAPRPRRRRLVPTPETTL